MKILIAATAWLVIVAISYYIFSSGGQADPPAYTGSFSGVVATLMAIHLYRTMVRANK